MSFEAVAIAMNHSASKGSTKLVLIGIASHAGDGGSWPSRATLARYAGGIAPTYVTECINRLEELGEIQRDVNAGGLKNTPHDRRPNLYHFLLTCPPECDGTTQHRITQSGSTGTATADPAAGSTTADPAPPTGSTGADPRGPSQQTPGVGPSRPEPIHEPTLGTRGGGLRNQVTSDDVDKNDPPYESLGGSKPGSEPVAALRPDVCRTHQGFDYPPPCRACAAAKREMQDAQREASRERQEQEQERQKDEIRAMRQLIDRCDLCDVFGYRGGVPCQHDPDMERRNTEGAAKARAAIKEQRAKARELAEAAQAQKLEDARAREAKEMDKVPGNG